MGEWDGKMALRVRGQGDEAAELWDMRFLLKASWGFLERRKAENRRDRNHQRGHRGWVMSAREPQCYGARGKQETYGQKTPNNNKYFRTCTTPDSCNGRISRAPTNPGNFIKKPTMPGHIWNYDTSHPFLCQNPPSLSCLKKLFIINTSS